MNAEKTILSCITYNILSDRWSTYDPSRPETEKLKYRYEFVDPELLTWSNRLPRIVEKVSGCDIICLQEVDLDRTEEIAAVFPDYDYYSHIIWTPEMKKTVPKRTCPLGNMILWKHNINCVEKKSNSSAVMCLFTVLDTSSDVVKQIAKQIAIVNVHLRGGTKFERDRCSQLKSCLKLVDDIPAVICGDFNDEFDPNGGLMSQMTQYKACDSQLTCDCYNSELKVHNYHAFDHIWYRSCDVVQELCLNTEQPIPNPDEPSDHLPVRFVISL